MVQKKMTDTAISEANVLQYLRVHYPHLYDVQMQVKKVINDSGYGDVSVVLRVTEGLVDKGEVLGSSNRIYFRRTRAGTWQRIDTK